MLFWLLGSVPHLHCGLRKGIAVGTLHFVSLYKTPARAATITCPLHVRLSAGMFGLLAAIMAAHVVGLLWQLRPRHPAPRPKPLVPNHKK